MKYFVVRISRPPMVHRRAPPWRVTTCFDAEAGPSIRQPARPDVVVSDTAEPGRRQRTAAARVRYHEGMDTLEERLKQEAHARGFALVGIAPATEADGFGRLRDWLARGF